MPIMQNFIDVVDECHMKNFTFNSLDKFSSKKGAFWSVSKDILVHCKFDIKLSPDAHDVTTIPSLILLKSSLFKLILIMLPPWFLLMSLKLHNNGILVRTISSL